MTVDPDLAVLRSALALESSLEHYEMGRLEEIIGEGLVERLAPLFDPRHHEALHAAYAARTGTPYSPAPADTPRQVLEDLVANERSARNFYYRQADHLRDPELQALFRRMAQDEQAHLDLLRSVIEELDVPS